MFIKENVYTHTREEGSCRIDGADLQRYVCTLNPNHLSSKFSHVMLAMGFEHIH